MDGGICGSGVVVLIRFCSGVSTGQRFRDCAVQRQFTAGGNVVVDLYKFGECLSWVQALEVVLVDGACIFLCGGLALNLDIAVWKSQATPDFKVSLLMAVQFTIGAWAEVTSTTIMHCFCKVGFAGDASDVESCHVPAEEEMIELWCAANGGYDDVLELQEFLHADDTVATNEELSDEAIITAVTETQDKCSGDDDNEPESMQVQVMSHKEASRMIDSLRDFVSIKNLPLGHVQHLDSLQQDVGKLVAKQSKLTNYGFLSPKK
ncbi:hypothetical protein HPB50_010795 [Hyalomma asiaticum]|uniref:Uncharacterized protein n=1 Tax=Hyalomma asiaticum TaxID=266040 RepID=A0ACB7TIT8_HYAAI|nr:hypothetical protein HPB50_010795 [Hyalomma asiaticum]